MPLIEVKNLEKTYYTGGVDTPVLNDISFSVEKGEFVAIVGPSGSGKSTLLHILGFLDNATGGEYKFEGKSFSDYSKKEIAFVRNKKMGFVFQAFNLLPRTTVLDNVKLPLLYSDVPKSQHDGIARRAIESVGLSDRMDHEASQLSGGEKQRVAIARALVNSPSVIFADEPTGNLDSKSGEVVMEIIQRLNKEGQTILLITHESYTAGYAGRVIRILDGEIESDKVSLTRNTEKGNFRK